MKKIRILIVDDHKMIRDGLKVMLESNQDSKYEFYIDEADSGEAAYELVKKNAYSIILLDFQLPGMSGAETAKIIMRKKPGSKILALSNYNEFMYVDQMLSEGKAKGYILKNVGPIELAKAIDTILNNKNYYSNEITQVMMDNVGVSPKKSAKQVSVSAMNKLLSRREIEVLKLIAEENSSDDIAGKLEISRRTVDTHRQHIMLKLNIRSNVGLIKTALQLV